MFKPALNNYTDEIYNIKDSSKELKSALDLLNEELGQDKICFNEAGLEEIGGISCREITELCGLPGTGKTQLCLYMSIIVQFPKDIGGLNGDCIYVDTSANFTTSRIKGMFERLNEKFVLENHSLDATSILKRIHYIEAFGTAQLCAVIQLLSDFISTNGNIRLIMIDSIGYPFKDGCPEMNRTGILYRILNDLQILAKNYNIAVVITNEVSTRIGIGAVPSLGDTYSHRTGRRLILTENAIAFTHSNLHPYKQIFWNGVEGL